LSARFGLSGLRLSEFQHGGFAALSACQPELIRAIVDLLKC
jgi:hypothetical protein